MKDDQGIELTRRQVLAAGAGLWFSFSIPRLEAASRPEAALNAWVLVRPDDSIVIYSPAAEMGQGSFSAIPMIFAEELDADWRNVRIEPSPADDALFHNPTQWIPGIMLTLGSSAVSGYFDSVRLLGAQARAVLLNAAALHWGVSIDSLVTEASAVIHQDSGRRLSYGELSLLVDSSKPVPVVNESDLKREEDFRIIGANLPRFDLPEKVNGAAQYSIDVDLPGMVYATVQHSPVPGATLLSIDNINEILRRPGIVAVIDSPSSVAIVATNYQAALDAEPALLTTWSEVPTLSRYSDTQGLEQHLALVRDTAVDGIVVQQKGEIDQAFQDSSRTWQREYLSDYVYHAQIEPLNAVAMVSQEDSTATVWAGTQAPTHCTRAIAAELNIDVSQVTLNRTYLGGGFGRRAGMDHDYVIDAVRLAKHLGRPVKVIWSRREDVKTGRFKPIKAVSLRAAQDSSGKLSAWHHRTVSDEALKMADPLRYEIAGGWPVLSGSGADTDYAIENVKAEIVNLETGVRIAALRGIGATVNKFAAESLIDEIAHDTNRDPLRLRMELLQDQPVALSVLTAVADMSGWETRTLNAGYGTAFDSANYPTAYVVKIALDRSSGAILVSKIWVALDVGLAIHPRNIHSQLEGQIIFGIGNALKERITMSDGKVDQSNFVDYPTMRIHEVPDMEIQVLTRKGAKPAGVGDSRLAPIPAAIANAFADLTGKRLLHMPFIPERVTAALNG